MFAAGGVYILAEKLSWHFEYDVVLVSHGAFKP